MKKKTIFFILTVSLYYRGNSQFLVLQQKPYVNYFHTILKQTTTNRFSFLVERQYPASSNLRARHQIVTYDFNGNFIDSVNLPKGFVPISFPLKYNNSYYWSCIYADTAVSQSSTQVAFVLKFDNNFKCVAKTRMSNVINPTSDYPSNIIEVNSKLFVAINSYTNYSKIYRVDTLLNKLDSVFFNSGANAIEIQKTPTNKIMIAGYNFPPLGAFGSSGSQKVIMDTSLKILDTFVLDSLTFVTAGGSVVTGCSSQIGVSGIFSFKILPITSSKNFILGRFGVVYNNSCSTRVNIVHSIINNNNKVLNTKLINDTTRNVSYIDNVNFTDFKNNFIYSVGTEGYNYQIQSILQPQKTSILVCKSDTSGNLVWKKRFGDDMFYRPVSIIQTLDSGFLVSGIRYNALQTSYPNIGESFILRLDKDGNLISVGINENSNSNFVLFKCYPNPTSDIIYFDVPLITNYQLVIYDLLGKVVYSNSDYCNSCAVSTLNFNSGLYMYSIKTKQSLFTGKFIKQ